MNKRKLKRILKTLISFLGGNETFFEFYKSYQKQLENDTEKERLKIRCKKQKEKAKNSIWEREFVLHSAFDNA